MAQRINTSQSPIVMKSSSNGSTLSGLTNSNNDFSGQDITVTVATGTTAQAFVILSVGVNSSTDFEFQPRVLVNGTETAVMTPAASLGGGRAHVRVATGVVSLSAGTNTIRPRVLLASSTSAAIQAGGLNLAVIAIGNVS